MKTIFKIFIFSFFSMQISAQTFINEQLKFERVKSAYQEKWDKLSTDLQEKGLSVSNYKLFIRAFKNEDKIELWVSKRNKEEFILFKTYRIVTKSGSLGPKRTSGDLQVPEGFYTIDRFNPMSNFYLSLGINYPNKSDSKIGKIPLGGDIFIHGSNVTIGCLPLTDEYIKEVYLMAVMAKNNGQKNIYVHIFPIEFKKSILEKYSDNSNYAFWKTLKLGYDYFETTKKLPVILINSKGEYYLK